MKYHESGFTIIETVLVLAVSGLVIAMVLVGIGNSLSHQRYTDAVSQSVDFFRGHYAVGGSTVNNRPDTQHCSTSGLSDTNPADADALGASSCLLLGKLLRSTNGIDISVTQVIALNDPSASSGPTPLPDSQALLTANLQEGDVIDNYHMEWSSKLLVPGTSNPAQFTIMIVRSPVSGTVHTFSANTGTARISELLSAGDAAQVEKRMCVDHTGFFGLGAQPMGIAIARGAVNTTGVQVIPAGECV